MRRLFVVFVSIILLFATGCQSVTIVSTKATESNESIFSISDESIVSTSIAKGGNIKESVYIPTDNYNTTDNNAASLSMQPHQISIPPLKARIMIQVITIQTAKTLNLQKTLPIL